MIELLAGLPADVVGFEAVGDVSACDYEQVVVPAIDRALEAHGKIRLIHVLGHRLERHEAGALWDDAEIALSHARSLERIAVVTDIAAIRALVTAGGWSAPGEMRLFSTAEREEAIAWASADREAVAAR